VAHHLLPNLSVQIFHRKQLCKNTKAANNSPSSGENIHDAAKRHKKQVYTLYRSHINRSRVNWPRLLLPFPQSIAKCKTEKLLKSDHFAKVIIKTQVFYRTCHM